MWIASRIWTDKRAGVALLILSLTGLLLSQGCGNTEPETVEEWTPPPIMAYDTSETLHQRWLVPGDQPAGAQDVWKAVNAVLSEEINLTVSMERTSFQIWSNQVETLLASDNTPDALFVMSGVNYQRLASKELLMPIDLSMVARSAPRWKESLDLVSSTGLLECEVDGVARMLPAVGDVKIRDWAVLLRGDLSDKHGLPEVNTLDDFDAWLDTLAKFGDMVPWNADPANLLAYLSLAWFQPAGMVPVIEDFPFLAWSVKEESPTVLLAMEDEAFLDALFRLRHRVNAGSLPEAAMYSRTATNQQWMLGQSAAMVSDLDTISELYAITLRQYPDWKPVVHRFNPTAHRIRQPLNMLGMAIPIGAAEPERTLMALDLLHSRVDLQAVTVAGIEGIHRKSPDGAAYEPAENAGAYPYGQGGSWAWQNIQLMPSPGTETWLTGEAQLKWLLDPDRAPEPALSAFVFDPAPVALELSSLGRALEREGRTLLAGTSENITTDLEKLILAFEEAGIRRVQEEMQRQVEVYLQAKSSSTS